MMMRELRWKDNSDCDYGCLPAPPTSGQANEIRRDTRLLLTLCNTADRLVAKLKKKDATKDADIKVGERVW